jgi:hypothetical protein
MDAGLACRLEALDQGLRARQDGHGYAEGFSQGAYHDHVSPTYPAELQ